MSDDDSLKEWIRELDEGEEDEEIKNFLQEDEGDDRSFEPGSFQSRDYKTYLDEEARSKERNWYEKLVDRLAFFRKEFPDMKEEQQQAITLLDWDLAVDQIVPAATVLALLIAPFSLFPMMLPIPFAFKAMFILLPMVVFYYIVKYPSLKAQQKVVKSSEGLVLSVLYMVVYMRHSPNLEGAVTFAARHLDGPVARDLNKIMWQIDMRVYETVEEALSDYIHRWKPYNRGYVESITLLQSAMRAPNAERRKEMLNESVDTLLESTRRQMNTFARNLKMPIMVVHGLGILLPVLGIILFPLVANFMGGDNMVYYLSFLYNFVLPLTVYAIIRTLLTQRPMSFATARGNTEATATIEFDIGDRHFEKSMFWVSVPLFLLLVIWPGIHYYNIIFTEATWPMSPGMVTMFREAMLLLAIAIPVGVHFLYGYTDNIETQEKVGDIEQEFPKALYELGNALDKGQPIERAVDDAIEGSRELEISNLFQSISYNIKQYGLTFSQAVFDERVGAIAGYPSQLVATILEIVSESTQKGTKTAATSIISISEYLQNIQETQEKLEDLMSDTLSSVTFLGYVLAPVISGIAVGMGATISTAFSTIGAVFEGAQNASGGAPTGGAGAGAGAPTGGLGGEGASGMLSLFQVESAIPPGVLQFVVGVYILQISFLIGLLIVRLNEGNNPVRQKVTVGKLFISASLFYSIVVVVIVAIFGSIIAGVGSQ